ncbi:hypothetical protein BDZ97DRAFT_1827114 [Flammula alnicola]|nr:hypothetical protein BDZ97DRAFT_1827114 [Flammula alnicola]
MKFFVITLVASFAFFSQAFAAPSPQTITEFTCGGEFDLQCPTGYRCCLIFTIISESPLSGSCQPGRFGVCPL